MRRPPSERIPCGDKRVPTIPDELMDHLHEATMHLRAARQDLDRAMAGTEYRHQERVDVAEGRLRQVQREIEEIDRKIRSVWQRST